MSVVLGGVGCWMVTTPFVAMAKRGVPLSNWKNVMVRPVSAVAPTVPSTVPMDMPFDHTSTGSVRAGGSKAFVTVMLNVLVRK